MKIKEDAVFKVPSGFPQDGLLLELMGLRSLFMLLGPYYAGITIYIVVIL
jgi:hypothetical protein